MSAQARAKEVVESDRLIKRSLGLLKDTAQFEVWRLPFSRQPQPGHADSENTSQA